jgi:hypothetical protein
MIRWRTSSSPSSVGPPSALLAALGRASARWKRRPCQVPNWGWESPFLTQVSPV